MILHLIDDEKFIDDVIENFDSLSVESEYVVLYNQNYAQPTANYIQKKERIRWVEISSEEYRLLLAKDWELVWVHCRMPHKEAFVAKLKPSAKVFWSTFGSDYLSLCGLNLYKPLTRRLEREHLRKSRQFYLAWPGGRQLHWLLRCVRRRRIETRFSESKAFLERVDYYSTIFPSEQDHFKKFPKFRAAWLPFHYATALKTFDSIVAGDAIWIGNSRTYSNNHADAFDQLSKLALAGREIYVPLSYGWMGGSPSIEEIGRQYFGAHFHPLVDFVSRDKYVALLQQCGFYIFNHIRQQAAGNINMALSMGGKVFLSEASPIYTFYKGHGMRMFSIERELTRESLSTRLTPEDARHNQELMIELFGHGKYREDIKATVATVLGRHV